jgi:TolB protein
MPSAKELTIRALNRPTVVRQNIVRHRVIFIVWAAVCGAVAHGQAPTRDTVSAPRRVTKIVNSYPAPSPDGSRVVFQSNRSGVFQIYSMKTDGSDVRQLTDMPNDSYGPSYAPDGKLIAFAHGSGGKSDIYIMASDGSAARQLTTDGLDNSHPHWSPDGRRILFNSSRTTPTEDRADRAKEQDDIFSVALDRTDLRQHTRCRTVCTYAFFSPDMKRIAYRKVTNTPGLNWDLSESMRNSEVAVANADGSDERILTNNAAFDGWPAWSPDGKYIAFASNRLGPANHGQIFVMSPDGSAMRQISALPGSYVQPFWSADGRNIYAYNANEVGDDEWGDVVVFVLDSR